MQKHLFRIVACLAGLVGLYGCSGGGGGGDGGSNAAPTAAFNANPDTGAVPLAVDFDASASSDSDGTIASYSWNFGDSSTGTGITTSHQYTTTGTFTVTLTVTDNDGATATATHSVTVTDGSSGETISLTGTVTYDRVPFETAGDGLDYAATFEAPARDVVVQLVQAGGTVLAQTTTGDDGRYAFSAPVSTDVFVRVRARLLHTSSGAGDPGWDISILNNTNGNAQYVLDGSVQNTGTADQTRNLNAASGWPGFGGTAYSGTRAAAPFAIADTIYEAVKFIVQQGDSAQVFSPLDIYWSPENRPVSGDDDYSDGEIGSTFYSSADGTSPKGIYVLGDDGVDTDEYDTHVLTHEFMHFIEYTIGRSDSIGGAHATGDKLDLRVAFSEGFGDAFSGMPLGDPVYRDSNGAAQGDEFNFNLESNTWMNPGWFSEGSIASILWDLYDSSNDGADTTSVPFSDMLDVVRNELRTGPALTSLFVFITALKTRAGVDVAGIDAIVAAQSIVASTMDAYATTETNRGNPPIAEALPLYTSIAINGGTKQVCGRADDTFFYNTIGNRRFLRFSLAADQSVHIEVVGLAGTTATPAPDPDLILWKNGPFDSSNCGPPACTDSKEVLERSLPAGDYVLEVYDYSNIDPTNGVRPSTCMNVSITG